MRVFVCVKRTFDSDTSEQQCSDCVRFCGKVLKGGVDIHNTVEHVYGERI